MKIAQKILVEYYRAKLNLAAVISPAYAAREAYSLFSTPQHRSDKPFPEIFQKAESISFTLNGKRTKGFRWNKGGQKRLLILHGYESSCRKFDQHISKGIRNGYEVIAFDAPAHGSSEGRSINAMEYAEMIRQINLRFGAIHSYICHSFGGMALSLYLEKDPHPADTKIVFIAPATETTTAIDGLFRFLQMNGKVRHAFDDIIFKRSGYPPSHYSIKRILMHIHGKVLWVHDEDDHITPLKDVLPVMDMAFPHVEFMITKGLGHNRIYRDTEVKRRIHRFLEMGS